MKTRFFFMLLFSLWVLNVSSQDTIFVVLSPSERGFKIPSDFAGLSLEKSDLNKILFSSHKDTIIRLFQTLGITSVRMGGNSVDKDTFSITASSTRFTRAELDSFYYFIQKVNGQVLMGLNFGGDFNPSLASDEVAYVMSNYASHIRGFEIGNESDLYYSNGFRTSSYNVSDYESQYETYQDTIYKYTPSAIFTGPAAASHYTSFTLPFCRTMQGKFTMLTQHYYVAGANTLPNHQQIVNLLNPAHLTSVLNEVNALVQCADSSGVPFRMAECNSLYNGGQWGVSNAFVSSLWALDYMYGLASKECAGVYFHGGLSGAYTPLAFYKYIYSARPISYGIMAFQVGSKGWIIPANVTNNKINLTLYSVIDSANNIYTTIINKDSLHDALIVLNSGSTLYTTASTISLIADSLADTTNVSLGGQIVSAYGTCQPYNWHPLNVSGNKTKLLVPASSASIIRFSLPPTNIKTQVSTEKDYSIFPNPSKSEINIFINDIEPDMRIYVFNASGNIVYSTAVNEQNTVLNMSPFNSGMYILKVVNKGFVLYTSKLIRE